MSIEAQHPVRTYPPDDGAFHHDDFKETHPAYAMIGAHRVSSMPGTFLAGSDFRHQHFVEITVRPAQMARGLGSDRYHSDGRQYIQVALSEAQWASFVSSMNVGDGIPCTLEQRDGPDGWEFIPGIAPITDRREQLRTEVRDNLDTAQRMLHEVIDEINASTLSVKGKQALIDRVTRAQQELGSNLDFVANQFDKHAEKTMERARVEINAMVTAAIHSAGLTSLGAGPVLELVAGEDETGG